MKTNEKAFEREILMIMFKFNDLQFSELQDDANFKNKQTNLLSTTSRELTLNEKFSHHIHFHSSQLRIKKLN